MPAEEGKRLEYKVAELGDNPEATANELGNEGWRWKESRRYSSPAGWR